MKQRSRNGRTGNAGPGAFRAPGESEPSWALPALGSYPDIGGEPGGDRRHDRGVRGGTAAALPEGAVMTSGTAPAPAAGPATEQAPQGWTGWLRRRWAKTLPPEKMLPDRPPPYVASWVYVFGMLTLSALLVGP